MFKRRNSLEFRTSGKPTSPLSRSLAQIVHLFGACGSLIAVAFAITGCGITRNPVPTITLSPSSLSWHKVAVGQTAGAKTITVTNSGVSAPGSSGVLAPLSISSIAVSPEFMQTATTCPSAPSTLAAGDSCTISVAFRPDSTGDKTGSLTLIDNVLDSPQSVSLSATGGVGSLLFDPSSLSFPGVSAGTVSQSQTVTLTNEQSTPITLTGFTVSGHFAQGNDCPMSPNTLAADASCSVTVTSLPVAAGSIVGSVNVRDGFGDVTQLYLAGSDSGSPVVGALSFSPASLLWGNVIVGQSSAAKTVTVTNTQSAPVAISNVVLGPDFIQSATTCPTAPATLAAGASCSISLTFRPSSSGAKTELLTLADDAANSPQSIPLSATGIIGSLLFSPTSLSFAGVDPGKVSPPQTATLTNVQSTDVTLASITASGHFAQTNDCPSTLAAQASCTVTVTSNPIANGSITGSINVKDGAGNTTQLYLKGQGGNTNQVVSFSPDSLTWGNIAVGQTSGAKTITLNNGQAVPLTISSISAAQDFIQTATTCPTAPATVAAGASCTISMAFRPYSAGAKAESITLTDDAPGGMQSIPLDGTGFVGSLLYSPTSLSFAGVLPGTVSQPQTATLTNEQSTDVTLASITSSGHFAQTNDCPTTLAAQASCTVTVTSNPIVNGSTAGSVNAKDGSGNTTQLYLAGMGGNLAGMGGSIANRRQTAQAVGFSPASLPWGNVAVGQISGAKTITLSNSQTVPLTISSIVLGADFTLTATTCPTTPATVAAGASCTVSVAFRPLSAGTKSESITFTDDASDSPHSTPLSATGIVGSLLFSPTSLTFAAVAPGTVSPSETSTLTNKQSTSLTLASITTSGHFAQTNNCPISPNALAANASCTITATSNPVTGGSITGSVNAKDSSNNVYQLYLSGAGTGGTTGAVKLSPSGHQFPDQAYGSSSSPYGFTLTNNQSTTLSISSIAVSTADYSQTNTCGSSLAASVSCTISVKFAPQSVGYKTATLSINDNASGSPQTASLTGNGVVPVAVSPPRYTFPNQAVGSTSSPVTVTLTNNQSVPLNISSVQLAAPFSQSNNCLASGGGAGTLPAGGSCTITIRYTPTSIGYSTANLTIADSAINSPQSVAIAGNSFAAVTVSPGSLGFSNQVINRPSSPQIITLTNHQSTPLTINSITSTGAGFNVTNTCSSTLAAGASCTISITFVPTAATSYSGSVKITNNAYGSPEVIPYVGTGIKGDTGVIVLVKPQAPCVLPSQTQQFTATVRNTSNPAVTWYVDSVKNGSNTVGTISASGLYVAPSATGTHTVTAWSQADTTVYGFSKFSVTSSQVFAINPFTSSIPVSGQQSFEGQICNVPDNNVTYSVDNIPGGNATIGTITGDGLYTAPNSPGKHTIRVTDATLNKTSGAIVTVYSNIAVDFGSRTNTKYPIPAGILGANHVDGLHNPADISLIANAGVTVSRTYAQIETVYATPTPNWTKIDPLIANLQAKGMHVLLQVAYTPVWLQPNPNPCGSGNTTAVPTNLNTWGQLAASYVAHMDAKFPGVVTDYEIWNEPDGTGICGNVNRLNAYLSIYAAAAPLMKQQAAADGVSIRVGGPTTTGVNPTWFPALLSNASTAPYVDFLSYHSYMLGGPTVDATWDTYNGETSLYQQTQGPGGAGPLYAKAASLVAAGKQPLGAFTPIYVDEYNTNWAFIQDCCRNDPTYSPVWNAMYVSDLLNTVYSGTAAVPGKLSYYAASAYPYFCLIGTWDTDMDCQYSQGSTPEPYPQYYAYQLMASPNYLAINSGGYMAASIAPPSGGGGLVTTAFYTANQDSILIVNPTATDYSQITISMQNVGFSSPHALLYQIVNGQSINSSSLALTPAGNAYTARISVPAYTVMAISVQGP